ncbi:plasmid mobilization relaxosome protein MobC [Aeromonas jandaei]|nr:plasmid mobilization relaxosome protein MobC [Aeromonas veronii bv. veronii]
MRQLAALGSNLNQIARRINASPLTTLDKVEYLAALAAVARERGRSFEM